MTQEELIALAGQIGFTHVCALSMDALIFRKEVREMCAVDRCKSFGRSWSCPPACGTLEQCEARARRYSRGILVQTTEKMEDDFDLTAIRAAETLHKKRFDTLVRQVRMLHPDCMPMAAGACTRCHRCTYPEHPCRYPSRLYPSMEACGLWVSDVCVRSGAKYNYGSQTITYTACILIQ